MTRVDELAKLDALRRSGALSEEEFQAEKVRVLANETVQAPPRPPPMDTPARPDAKAGAWIAVIGGALLAISSFLPWFTASVFDASISRNGMQLGQDAGFSVDGLVTLLLGLVIIVIGISRLANFQAPSWLQRSPIVAGLVASLIVVLDIPGINHLVNQVRNASSYATAAVGFGVYLAIVGGIVAAIGGASMRPVARTPITSVQLEGGASAPRPAAWTEAPNPGLVKRPVTYRYNKSVHLWDVHNADGLMVARRGQLKTVHQDYPDATESEWEN